MHCEQKLPVISCMQEHSRTLTHTHTHTHMYTAHTCPCTQAPATRCNSHAHAQVLAYKQEPHEHTCIFCGWCRGRRVETTRVNWWCGLLLLGTHAYACVRLFGHRKVAESSGGKSDRETTPARPISIDRGQWLFV